MSGIDTGELAERDKRIRTRDKLPLTQPPVTEGRTGAGGSMLLGVIREKPADDAPYLMVQLVRPTADYATTAGIEFIEGSMRPVLCEPKTLAGDYPDRWVWQGEDPDDSAIVVHWLVMWCGMLFIIHKGRQQYTDTSAFVPTDCYLFGS